MARKIKVNKGAEPCPKCGNDKDFVVHSAQVAEDCCEIWATCKCGYKPDGNEIEDVWGGTGNDNCYDAMSVWNDCIRDLKVVNP